MKTKLQSLLFLGLVMLAAWLPASSYAGYAQVAPPAGWAANAYRAAANDASFINGIRTAAGLTTNVGGRAVTIPLAFRYAANAGSVAARAAFLNPWAVAGVAVGSAVYTWYTSGGYEVVDGVWHKRPPAIYTWYNNYDQRKSYTSADAACKALGFPGAGSVTIGGQYPRSAGCTNGAGYFAYVPNGSQPVVSPSAPATPADFEADHINLPIPAGLPQLLPVPLPVEQPIINPSADPVPVPQPLRVPVGDPVPVPNTDPQRWKTPVIDIVPSPTPSEPWRVDEQPKEVITDSPDPQPIATPPANPASGTVSPAEFNTCGLPGSPACKIDETGTKDPVKDTEFNPKADALKDPKEKALDRMKGPEDTKTLFSGWNVFWNVPPLVACEPFVLPDRGGVSMGSIDACGVVDGMRTVMAYIWAVAGLFLCISMIRETIQGG